MKPPGPRPTPVQVRGITYPSAKAAAESLGVSTRTVYDALDRGKPDNIGLGRGHKDPKEEE